MLEMQSLRAKPLAARLYVRHASRAFDVLIAAAGLIVLMPVMLLVAAVIKLSDGGPVLFRQERIGHGGRRFRCLKFRTMVTDAEARLKTLLASDARTSREWLAGQKLEADPRITPLGRFLRRTSLDELPQLFNVLKGDMAIVGPRPIVADEVKRYGRYYSAYCAVRPGITGLWQVSGRNGVSYRRRVALDTCYVRYRSLLLDLVIVLRTIPAMVQQTGR